MSGGRDLCQDGIRFLAREAGAKTAGDVLRVAGQVIGGSRLLPRARFVVREMFPGDPAESSAPGYGRGRGAAGSLRAPGAGVAGTWRHWSGFASAPW